jgi:hypothetical protein
MPTLLGDGRCGDVVDVHDPKYLARGLAVVLSDQAAGGYAAEVLRQRVRPYSWATVAERVEREYLDLVWEPHTVPSICSNLGPLCSRAEWLNAADPRVAARSVRTVSVEDVKRRCEGYS